MKYYREIANLYQERLQHLYPEGEIKQLFLMVYAHLTDKKAIYFNLDSVSEVDAELADSFIAILEDLMTARPIQHILGVADFYGMRLQVNEHTLIPRPETEELVDYIVKKHQNQKTITLLDVGTGSGCIAIALKKHLPQADVFAMDISREALEIAKENAKAQQLHIHFIHADILEWDAFMQPEQQFDVIVSNPPYITPKEQATMHQNVLFFEPHQALFVEEHTPLLFYDSISEMGKKHLKPNGMLYLEINQYLAKETAGLIEKKGYHTVKVLQDINYVDRMLSAKWYT